MREATFPGQPGEHAVFDVVSEPSEDDLCRRWSLALAAVGQDD